MGEDRCFFLYSKDSQIKLLEAIDKFKSDFALYRFKIDGSYSFIVHAYSAEDQRLIRELKISEEETPLGCLDLEFFEHEVTIDALLEEIQNEQ